MKQTIQPTNKLLTILTLSCTIFTPSSIGINLISHFALKGNLMHVWACLLVFIIIFIVSAFLVLKHSKQIQNKAIIFGSCMYTIISFSINLFVFIIMDGSLWKIESSILILIYSAIFAYFYYYLKIKSYLKKTIIYYALSLTSFLILTVAFAKYNSGNTVVLLLSIFSIVFIIIAVIIYYVKKAFQRFENEEKPYKRLLD